MLALSFSAFDRYRFLTDIVAKIVSHEVSEIPGAAGAFFV
jgi:hypothetical protein